MAALPTPAYVILGMLRLGARSGYDVKRLVDGSTRYFWTISQAQIYPLLKRLEDEGLVRGRAEPRGRRPRRAYELTRRGEQELVVWLRDQHDVGYELRDLGMLKLFFADVLEPAEVLEHVRAMRARAEQVLEHLDRDSQPYAAALRDAGRRHPLDTLRLGIALHQAALEFCTTLEAELA
jgi:PadR family transcriptional regulator, regulatory protein AphA